MKEGIIFVKAHDESFIAANSLEDAVQCAEMIYFPNVQISPVKKKDIPEEYQTSLKRVERDQNWRQKDGSYWLIKNWKVDPRKTNASGRDWKTEFKTHAMRIQHVEDEKTSLFRSSPYIELVKDIEKGELRHILDNAYIPLSLEYANWRSLGKVEDISVREFINDRPPYAENSEIHRWKKTDRNFSFGAFKGSATHTITQSVDANAKPQNLFFYKSKYNCYSYDVKIAGSKFKIARVQSHNDLSIDRQLRSVKVAFGLCKSPSKRVDTELLLDIEERIKSYSESRQAANGCPYTHRVMTHHNNISFFGYDIEGDDMLSLLSPPFLRTITIKWDKSKQ